MPSPFWCSTRLLGTNITTPKHRCQERCSGLHHRTTPGAQHASTPQGIDRRGSGRYSLCNRIQKISPTNQQPEFFRFVVGQGIVPIDRDCRLAKGQVFLWKEGQRWEDLWDPDDVITPP